MAGNFFTGCDMNITPADLDVIAEVSPRVFGRSVEAGGSGVSTEPDEQVPAGLDRGPQVKRTIAPARGAHDVPA